MAGTPTHPVSSFVILLNRLSLGLYFAIAGYNKIFNVGVGTFYDSAFRPNAPRWLPGFTTVAYGYSLPFLELLAGALLVAGFFTRLSALAITLMLVSIIIAMGVSDGVKPFHANLIFLTLAIMLMMIGPGGFSVDALRRGRRRTALSEKA